MRKKIILLFFMISMITNAQSSPKGFFDLSGPKKIWVLFHPFKAKKSYRISQEANRVSDSIAKTNVLDGDGSGGQVDAFRHAYWMARLRQEIGKSAAQSLGKAHERENYQTFKKNQLEDGVVPDEISSIMDLFNNEEGLKLTVKRSEISQQSLIYKVINAIKEGEMKIIKKNNKGDYVTCEGEIITPESLKGKWENNKCLIPSN
ncbi:hypothetical protein [Polaribacter sp. Hel_I_88]|uniref:DUF6973 domain-containing protein n=1 Tax=Polaribacter sp. Hel_I_88 TaxID=1250006 RepID=UPI00047A24DC|nr:hypothetical protein [Polaribacter sp. Hel_I_88]